MFKKIRTNQKGFTLVEVIVVAVIVAVLAAVAIPLYIGYINDANRNSANNAAGSATSFLAAAANSQANVSFGGNTEGSVWTATTPSGQNVTFMIPEGVNLKVTANILRATKGGQNSITHNY